jgi:HSP20 family molecular chaperone IbpA
MRRLIPPRTMRDVSKEISAKGRKGEGFSSRSNVTLEVGLGTGIREPSEKKQSGKAPESPFPTGLFRKPRNWRFQTKPLFKKVKGPLVDVFHEAEEVLIVIDLGGFRRRDVSVTMTPERYIICARRGDQVFQEDIDLPPEVDIETCVEYYRNGVLEIILPRKKKTDSD